jgi:hypothetical protein
MLTTHSTTVAKETDLATRALELFVTSYGLTWGDSYAAGDRFPGWRQPSTSPRYGTQCYPRSPSRTEGHSAGSEAQAAAYQDNGYLLKPAGRYHSHPHCINSYLIRRITPWQS